jgi:CBS domain-containing protein
MLVKEAMSRNVKTVTPEQSIREAARLMLEIGAGALPVGENDRIVGMITDRDIAVRGVAEGFGPAARIREVMSPKVKYCFEDEDIAHIARTMAQQQVRRLPVVNRRKRLVGILSLGDLAISAGTEQATAALSGISQAGGAHSQNA